MKKILWPRFGTGGLDAGRYLDASAWPLGLVAFGLMVLWAISIADRDEGLATVYGICALGFLMLVPLVRGVRSRAAIALLVLGQAVTTLSNAVDGSPLAALVSGLLMVYWLGLLRAAVRWHRGVDGRTYFEAA